MKGWWWYAVAFVAGVILCLVIGYFVTRGANAKLSADLAGIRTALVNAQRDLSDLTEQLRLLHGQLDRASELVASQQRELDGDKRLLANQQLILDAQKRGLAKLASDIAASGGDLRKQVRAFAEGFRRLYAIYHPGGK
jgi:hypothetical protein